MNDQERTTLNEFLSNLVQVKNLPKDVEAESMIQRAFAQQPDAAYLVVQRTLFLQEALSQAKNQIAQLQAAKAQPAPSFFGSDNWGSQRPAAPAPQQAPYAAAPAPAAQPSSFGSSFLGQAAMTAAGVAGGALLFQGIESMFSHHNGGGFGAGSPGENFSENTTVVNNYYGSDEGDSNDDSFASNDYDDSGSDDSWA